MPSGNRCFDGQRPAATTPQTCQEDATMSRPASTHSYRTLVEVDLGITPKFIEESRETIRQRLLSAGSEFAKAQKRHGAHIEDNLDDCDLFGVTQCLHLAS